MGLRKRADDSDAGNGTLQYIQLRRVGGFARKHSSQRIICSDANACGSTASRGPSTGRRTFSLSLGNTSSNVFNYTTSGKIRGELMFSQTAFIKQLVVLFVITIAFATAGCAALQPIDATDRKSVV